VRGSRASYVGGAHGVETYVSATVALLKISLSLRAASPPESTGLLARFPQAHPNAVPCYRHTLYKA